MKLRPFPNGYPPPSLCRLWNGTVIGVAYGGTGANLAGTSGISQFPRRAFGGRRDYGPDW